MSTPIRCLGAAALMLGAAGSAAAANLSWPAASGACAGTLQACINSAASGDSILIGPDIASPDSYTLIDENLTITRSLTLEARPGIDAVFAVDRGVFVSTVNEAGAASVTLRRLVFRNSGVAFNHRAGGVGTYTADRLRSTMDGAPPFSGCVFQFVDAESSRAHFIATNNVVEFRSNPSANCGMGALGQGGEWAVDFRGNRIRELNSGLSRAIQAIGQNFGDVTISGNQVDGVTFDSGIFVEERLGTGSHVLAIENNSVQGQESPVSAPVDNGISITPANADLLLVNNTVVRGVNGVRVFAPVAGAGTSTGRISNNLVAFNASRGLSIGQDTIVNRNNLLFGNNFNTLTPGPGTLTANPGLRGFRNPRLADDSIAINSGNNADLSPVFAPFDADGERRFIGTVDIGAFEFSFDEASRHLTTTANTDFNETRLPLRSAFGTSDIVQATPMFDAALGTEVANTLGVYRSNAFGPFGWSAFHENVTPMSTGRGFSGFVAFDGRPVFLHRSTLGNITDNTTRMDHPSLNNQVDAIAFVMHNYSPPGGPLAYHDQRIGVSYFANAWYIDNQDPASSMPSGRAFNVMVAVPGSPNVLRVIAGASSASLRLDHPLLDGNPCAAVLVTRNARLSAPTANNNTAFATDYVPGVAGAPGSWFIRAVGPGSPTFPALAGFNVMVHGPQANTCRNADVLFGNGFEG